MSTLTIALSACIFSASFVAVIAMWAANAARSESDDAVKIASACFTLGFAANERLNAMETRVEGLEAALGRKARKEQAKTEVRVMKEVA